MGLVAAQMNQILGMFSRPFLVRIALYVSFYSGGLGVSVSHLNEFLEDTWLTEFWIDRIHVVLQKGYILYA